MDMRQSQKWLLKRPPTQTMLLSADLMRDACSYKSLAPSRVAKGTNSMKATLGSSLGSQRLLRPPTPETGPRYASKRPAVIVPSQQISEAQAMRLALPDTGALSSSGDPNTFLRITTRSATPLKTKAILP